MQDLPTCNQQMADFVQYISMMPSSIINDTCYFDEKSLTIFESFVDSFIDADCWAIQVDNELIYNGYNDKKKTFLQILQNDIQRKHTNGHLLKVHLCRKNINQVNIYMFGQNPFRVQVQNENGFMIVKFFCE